MYIQSLLGITVLVQVYDGHSKSISARFTCVMIKMFSSVHVCLLFAFWSALRYTSGDGTPAGVVPTGTNQFTSSATAPSPWRDPAARLASHLVNIRAIVNHFTAKINAWATAHCLTSLTEEQVNTVNISITKEIERETKFHELFLLIINTLNE